MKKYVSPNMDVVTLELQQLMVIISGGNEGISGGTPDPQPGTPNYKGRGRYAEDDFDEEEEDM